MRRTVDAAASAVELTYFSVSVSVSVRWWWWWTCPTTSSGVCVCISVVVVAVEYNLRRQTCADCTELSKVERNRVPSSHTHTHYNSSFCFYHHLHHHHHSTYHSLTLRSLPTVCRQSAEECVYEHRAVPSRPTNRVCFSGAVTSVRLLPQLLHSPQQG